MVSLGDVAKEMYMRVDQGDSDTPALTKNGCFEMTKAVFDIMSLAIVSGEEVSIPKFGKFGTTIRNARKGRNPHSGKTIDIPAKMAIKFKPSSVLKESVGNMDLAIAEEKPAKDKKKAKKGKKKK